MLLQQSELHYSSLCSNSEMLYMPHHMSTAYFHHDRIFKLVTRWGKCIKINGEYDDKWWYFGGISDLHLKLWWLFIGSEAHWSLIYCTFLVGFKNNCRGSKTLKTHKTIQNIQNNTKHTKQYKTIQNNTKYPCLKFTFFCVIGCGYTRSWIGPVPQ